MEEGVERILELAKYKKNGRCKKLVVAGCMVERYREELKQSLPEVDRFLSIDELLVVANEEGTSSECFSKDRKPFFLYNEKSPRIVSSRGNSAYVKIAEGCDRPCAFCIIPKLRGSYRSRAADSVLSEVQALHESGIKEINLVAQDVTAYGSDLSFAEGRGRESQIESLLSKLSALVPEDESFWIRLLYSYPVGVTPSLVEKISSLPHVCRYLDLPLQHISHDVLKRMNRPLGEKGTRELIEMIRTKAPEVALRTTFLVGFPGETEEDVELLRSFVAEGHFAHLGVFPYSQESEAKSYEMPNQVTEEEKSWRMQIVMEAQQKVVAKRLKGFLGKTIPVLIEGTHIETDMLLSGRAEWQAPETDGDVIVNDIAEEFRLDEEVFLKNFFGRIMKVEINELFGYDLIGRLVCE